MHHDQQAQPVDALQGPGPAAGVARRPRGATGPAWRRLLGPPTGTRASHRALAAALGCKPATANVCKPLASGPPKAFGGKAQ